MTVQFEHAVTIPRGDIHVAAHHRDRANVEGQIAWRLPRLEQNAGPGLRAVADPKVRVEPLPRASEVNVGTVGRLQVARGRAGPARVEADDRAGELAVR